MERRIYIKSVYHGFFFANKRELLNQITEKCEVEISFPCGNIDEDWILIEGTSESIETAKQWMLRIVEDMGTIVTVECEIPRRHRRIVIGSRGCNVRAISGEFNVGIKFPNLWEYEVRHSREEDFCPDYETVRIVGRQCNAEAAKRALLGLVPITIKVDVPHEFHRFIKGEGGRDVRELRDKFNVNISLSRFEENLDYITIIGLPQRAEEAKQAILKKYQILKEEQEQRALESFTLKIEVNSEYHQKIIGPAGIVISKMMSDNDVTINFPIIGDPQEDVITIIGREENVHTARDDLMKIINELKQSDIVSHKVLEAQLQGVEISSSGSPNKSICTDVHVSYEHADSQKQPSNSGHMYEAFNDAKCNPKMERSIEKIQDVQTKLHKLHEKSNVSCNVLPCIEENEVAIGNTAEQLAEYRNVILEQEKKITELKNRFDDQVLTNNELELKHTKLVLDTRDKEQEYERIIQENQEKYDAEIRKMSEHIEAIETKLNLEREEKLKGLGEKNESSKALAEVCFKFQTLENQLTECEENVEFLQSSVKELKARQASLNNAMNRSENTHLDLILMQINETSKMSDSVSSDKQLSNIVIETVEDIHQSKIASQHTDDQISE